MPSIQPITDDLLIDAIQNATQRVVLIAPGVWPPVANAIAEAWQRLNPEQVTVILDVDPEVCRIGYGSLESIGILQGAATIVGEPIGQEPGVRICVLIADDQTFVFSPTPRQLEDAPGHPSLNSPLPPKANGLVLTRPPESLAEDLGSGLDGILGRRLGLETLNQEKLNAVGKDLERNPAKNFDLSKAVNVYNAKIQFVELTVKGCRLSEHRANLPKHLVHVLKKNPDLSRKIDNSIRLLDSEDGMVTDSNISQESIFKLREAIHDDFLRPVKGVGTVIERAKKALFLERVELLEVEVAQFAENVEATLAARFQATAEQLAGELLEDVLADLPERWRESFGPSPDPDRVRWRIVEDLLRAFGTPHGKVGKMKVAAVFKDATYDMLNDPDFQFQIAEYFPDLPVMEEFKAARERDNPSQTSLSW